MSTSAVTPLDKGLAETTQPVVSHSINGDTYQVTSMSTESRVENKAPQQFNLTQKISSLTTYDDPFKSLYRADWNSHPVLNEESPHSQVRSASDSPPVSDGSVPIELRDSKSEISKEGEVTYINGKFQKLTL